MRLALLVLLLAALPVRAQQTDVLFIGNSYTATNDLPYMFRQIALSLGDTVNTTIQAPGGYTFANHLFDPATQNAIASQQWDYVVLQEQSLRGALPTNETFSDIDATALNYDIQESSECAYPVFFMTWGYANGYNLTSWEYPELNTYAGMQQALRDNYTQFALENEGYVSPVGWAWKHVRDTHPDIELYQADESHPSVAGTYLAACVFYCTIFRESCVGIVVHLHGAAGHRGHPAGHRQRHRARQRGHLEPERDRQHGRGTHQPEQRSGRRDHLPSLRPGPALVDLLQWPNVHRSRTHLHRRVGRPLHLHPRVHRPLRPYGHVHGDFSSVYHRHRGTERGSADGQRMERRSDHGKWW
jgi:hypothetical protein